jgi:hypothetical protein
MNARTLGQHASRNPTRGACSSAGAAETRERLSYVGADPESPMFKDISYSHS